MGFVSVGGAALAQGYVLSALQAERLRPVEAETAIRARIDPVSRRERLHRDFPHNPLRRPQGATLHCPMRVTRRDFSR